jgi:hypothetical protein
VPGAAADGDFVELAIGQSPSQVIAPQSAQLLLELEGQQDEVLRDLDELNRRIEQVIASSQIRVRVAEAA